MKAISRLTVVLAITVAALASMSSVAFGASQLVYSDEFNGSLDTASWVNATPWNSSCTIGELEFYDPANCTLGGGYMTLKSENRPSPGYSWYLPTGFSYASGIVTSLRHTKFSYGYFEIRAKLPKGQGIWPAFWLTNDSTLEIDCLEMLGDRPSRIYQTWHRNKSMVRSTYHDGPDYSAGFHTYAIDWQPTYLKWYIDGVLTSTYTGAIPGDPLYICLNTAVGGEWPGSPTSATTFPVQYDIDYVRVFDTKPVASAVVASPDSYSTNADVALNVTASGVLANDKSTVGLALKASAVTQPTHGTLLLRSDGSFVYAPNPGYFGPDSFTYVASDGTAKSAATSVSLNVISTTLVTKPVVTRRSRLGTLTTYKVAGAVKPVSTSGATPVSTAGSAATAPTVLEVRIQRYTRGHWSTYAVRQVVSPASTYATMIRLRPGTYRVRTMVSRDGVAVGVSAWSRNVTAL